MIYFGVQQQLIFRVPYSNIHCPTELLCSILVEAVIQEDRSRHSTFDNGSERSAPRLGSWCAIWFRPVRPASIQESSRLCTIAVPSTAFQIPMSEPIFTYLLVTIAIDPKDLTSWLPPFTTCYELVKAEPECVVFEVLYDDNTPGVFTFLEGWTKNANWIQEVSGPLHSRKMG